MNTIKEIFNDDGSVDVTITPEPTIIHLTAEQYLDKLQKQKETDQKTVDAGEAAKARIIETDDKIATRIKLSTPVEQVQP